jgi:hypothetical protein
MKYGMDGMRNYMAFTILFLLVCSFEGKWWGHEGK